ncbi:hypothetical protein ElyMa_004469600 [Elysia marginata]|uniref:Uncharacterized protein n=1 Tax=Elysia marginata TaxID=1093978 RepID=A0AAV4HGZ3_9GAST|nr:hypothetical protein ElyMa_004469600 [Elysia marginata]
MSIEELDGGSLRLNTSLQLLVYKNCRNEDDRLFLNSLYVLTKLPISKSRSAKEDQFTKLARRVMMDIIETLRAGEITHDVIPPVHSVGFIAAPLAHQPSWISSAMGFVLLSGPIAHKI